MRLSFDKVLNEITENFSDYEIIACNNDISMNECAEDEIYFMEEVGDVMSMLNHFHDDPAQFACQVLQMTCHHKFDIGHDYFKIDAYEHLVSSNDPWELSYLDAEYLVEHPEVAKNYIDMLECEEEECCE